MVLPTPHIPPNMGGPEAQLGTLRGELEIGPKFWPPGPPWAPLDRPSPPPRALDFQWFLCTFCEGKIGGSKGGYHGFGGGEIVEKIQTAHRLIPTYPRGVGSM